MHRHRVQVNNVQMNQIRTASHIGGKLDLAFLFSCDTERISNKRINATSTPPSNARRSKRLACITGGKIRMVSIERHEKISGDDQVGRAVRAMSKILLTA